MNITLDEFLETIVRLRVDCLGEDENEVRKNINNYQDPIVGEFDIAYQTAIVVFCKQKGSLSDVDILREYLNEVYCNNNTNIRFK